MEIIKGILGLVLLLGCFTLIFGAIHLFMLKFFGIHLHGRYSGGRVQEQHNNFKFIVEDYTRKDPTIVNEAIARCKKKNFAQTHYNVLSEIRNIEHENSGKSGMYGRIKQNVASFYDNVIGSDSLSKIEKLERLNTLRKDGALTNAEYEDLKSNIIAKKDEIKSASTEKQFTHKDVEQAKLDYDKKNAIQTINTLYFEYKHDLPELEGIELIQLHEIILKNRQSSSLINNYNSLFKLYSNNLITLVEFSDKKKQLLISSLK